MSRVDVKKVQIYLFDACRVVVDNVEITAETWKSKKALLVLKYLATNYKRRISREELLELLWPDCEYVDNSRSLHTAVWSVRKTLGLGDASLGRSLLRYATGLYWLDCGNDGFIDIQAFENSIQEAKKLDLLDPKSAIIIYESALGLYLNDFLSEDLYEEWTIPFRTHFKELYLDASYRLANLLCGHSNDFKKAIDVCRRALRQDSTREEFYQVMIWARSMEQNYAEAIHCYEQCSKVLKKEFQLDPSPHTKALVNEIKQKLASTKYVTDLDCDEHGFCGAYTCDPALFRSIFHLEERRLERSGRSFSIVILASKNGQSWITEQYQEAFNLIQSSLRRCDVICQWSTTTVLILLPETTPQGTKAVYRRLMQLLKHELEIRTQLNCEVIHSTETEKMKNILHVDVGTTIQVHPSDDTKFEKHLSDL